MAYHDLNGNVMIDEGAAQADIQRAARAESILRDSLAALRNVTMETEYFQGETAAAIAEKNYLLQKRVEHMIAELQEMQAYIRQVISRYQELDRKWREILAQESLHKIEESLEKGQGRGGGGFR